jgi:hypothetical protein
MSQHNRMSRKARIAFLALVIAQAAHSIEEYVFRLYDVFAPARFVSRLISANLRTGFIVVVLGQGMLLALTGVVLGLGLSFGVTRFMSSFLLGVSSTDALTFSAVAALLGVVVLVSCLLPTRRATRVDPMIARRQE